MNNLILQYQQKPTAELERHLLDAHSGVINKQVKRWSGVLPPAVLDAHARTYAVDAFKTYDPTKAHINTHLYNHLSQLGRLNYQHQNIFRIPEHQIRMISQLNSAKAHLLDSLGRDARADELADYIGVPTKHIERLMGNLRTELASDSHHDQATGIGASFDENRMYLLDAIRRLPSPQLKLFNAIEAGKKPGQIAKELGVKSYELSRMKKDLAEALK